MRLFGLGIAWGIATFAGFILAVVAGIGSFLGIMALVGCDLRSVAPLADSCSTLDLVVLFLAALIGGAGLGVAQFAILRLFQVSRSLSWIPATSLGFAIPVTVEVGFAGGYSLLGG